MTNHFDVIVVGAGVVGASSAFHLATLGGLRVCVVDKGPVCAGGTAKSCAIVRTHYSIPSNTALAVASLDVLANFREKLGIDEIDSGFVNSGYLILAPPGDTAESLKANLALQRQTGANTIPISHEEAQRRHPRLILDGVEAVGFEPESGYADPYLTTTGFLKAARARGAVVRTDTAVRSLIFEAGRVRGVRTADGDLFAGSVLLAVGPWTAGLLAETGVDLHLAVSRHIVLTFRGDAPYAKEMPVVKDLTTANKMYFRPATGGVVLVGTGDYGDPDADPDDLDERVEEDFVVLQGGQLAARLRGFAAAAPTADWVGPYDITPDWNPVLGPLPGIEGLTVAYGFSGHGFKLAPAVGRMLAHTMLGRTPEIDITPYRLGRFDEGRLLTGSYGVGSIS